MTTTSHGLARELFVHILVDVVRDPLLGVGQTGQSRVPTLRVTADALAPPIRSAPISASGPVQARNQDQVVCTQIPDSVNRGLHPIEPILDLLAIGVEGVGVEIAVPPVRIAIPWLIVQTEDGLGIASPLLGDAFPQVYELLLVDIFAVVLKSLIVVVGIDDHVRVQFIGDVVDGVSNTLDQVHKVVAQCALQTLPSNRQPKTI
mmetsp:Transcript_51924/g.131868  ORF Transcript_51924/g.131868 Transcript_51924/m.131868 type:complete len:204 (-) Transcript_51924:335-946(-)